MTLKYIHSNLGQQIALADMSNGTLFFDDDGDVCLKVRESLVISFTQWGPVDYEEDWILDNRYRSFLRYTGQFTLMNGDDDE